MCVRLILVLVLGRQTVYGQKTVYLCLSTYIVFENTHTHSNVRVTTAASETEGVAAVSWIESLMIRRPFGSIDPNSIRETEHVCTWYQRALRYQLRGRPFHPWAGRLRFSGEAHPGPATLTQSSSCSCGAGLQSESRLLLCCAPVTRDHATHVYSSVHACC